jgi:hypothetical protein
MIMSRTPVPSPAPALHERPLEELSAEELRNLVLHQRVSRLLPRVAFRLLTLRVQSELLATKKKLLAIKQKVVELEQKLLGTGSGKKPFEGDDEISIVDEWPAKRRKPLADEEMVDLS